MNNQIFKHIYNYFNNSQFKTFACTEDIFSKHPRTASSPVSYMYFGVTQLFVIHISVLNTNTRDMGLSVSEDSVYPDFLLIQKKPFDPLPICNQTYFCPWFIIEASTVNSGRSFAFSHKVCIQTYTIELEGQLVAVFKII